METQLDLYGPFGAGVVIPPEPPEGAVIHVKARVHREGKFYVIDIPGYGVTQADTPRRVLPMVQDYVAMLAGVDPGQVVVQLQL